MESTSVGSSSSCSSRRSRASTPRRSAWARTSRVLISDSSSVANSLPRPPTRPARWRKSCAACSAAPRSSRRSAIWSSSQRVDETRVLELRLQRLGDVDVGHGVDGAGDEIGVSALKGDLDDPRAALRGDPQPTAQPADHCRQLARRGRPCGRHDRQLGRQPVEQRTEHRPRGAAWRQLTEGEFRTQPLDGLLQHLVGGE